MRESAAAECRAKGVKAATLKANLSLEAETAPLVARAAEAIGPLTALINSASLFENDDWQSATRAKLGRSYRNQPARALGAVRRPSPSSCPTANRATSSTSSTSGC